MQSPCVEAAAAIPGVRVVGGWVGGAHLLKYSMFYGYDFFAPTHAMRATRFGN